MIEDDIKLQEEERILTMKVKKLQAKRRGELQEGKNLYSVAQEHQMHRKDTKAE
jgi:ribosomal 50S subunit-recycling heat shock protein